jgi:cytochrome b561
MFSLLNHRLRGIGIASIRRKLSGTAGAKEHSDEAYSTGVKIMHWMSGGCVLGCVGFVQYAQNVKGKAKGDAMFYHKSFGLAAAGLLVPRLAIRAMSKAPPSFSPGGVEKLLADASHFIMYGMLVVMPVTGVAMGYYGGKGLPFFWTTLPGAEVADGATAKQAFGIHKQVGWYMEMLILGHLGGVAGHMIRGHPILPRILPFK